jgi:hypothetical protein
LAAHREGRHPEAAGRQNVISGAKSSPSRACRLIPATPPRCASTRLTNSLHRRPEARFPWHELRKRQSGMIAELSGFLPSSAWPCPASPGASRRRG